MKRFIPVFLLCFITLTSYAQNFSIPETELIDNAMFEQYNIFQLDIFRENIDSLSLSWKLLEKSHPEEWGITLCDYGQCYGGFPQSATMSLLYGDDHAFIKLDINPGTTAGTGIFHFLIFEGDNQAEGIEMFFEITAGAASVTVIEQSKIKMFPNPTNQFLAIESDLDLDEVFIYNMHGQLIEQFPPIGRFYDVSHLQVGTYIVGFQSDGKMIQHQKLQIFR